MNIMLAAFLTFLGPDLIIIGAIVFAICAPIILACWLNRRFETRFPEKRPYRWGYWYSLWFVYQGLGVGIKLEAGIIGILTAVGIHAILAWFFARRRKWAWVAVTIISCNPLVWIINFLYLRKRWNEDSGHTPTV